MIYFSHSETEALKTWFRDHLANEPYAQERCQNWHNECPGRPYDWLTGLGVSSIPYTYLGIYGLCETLGIECGPNASTSEGYFRTLAQVLVEDYGPKGPKA